MEAILNQVDEVLYDLILMKDFVGHEWDPSLLDIQEKERINNLTNSNNHNRDPYFTTKVWKICIEWQDGTTSWLPMVDVKNSFTFELAEHVIKNNLQNHPSFSWWVNYTMKKKEVFIKATKSTYSQRTHKFGVKVPESVQEALAID